MTEEYCSENTDEISSQNQVDLNTPENLYSEPVVTYNPLNNLGAEVENQLDELAEFLSSVTNTTEKQGYIVDFIDSLQDVSILEQCLSSTANVEIINLFSSMPDYSIILLGNPNIREQQTMAILNTIMLKFSTMQVSDALGMLENILKSNRPLPVEFYQWSYEFIKRERSGGRPSGVSFEAILTFAKNTNVPSHILLDIPLNYFNDDVDLALFSNLSIRINDLVNVYHSKWGDYEGFTSTIKLISESGYNGNDETLYRITDYMFENKNEVFTSKNLNTLALLVLTVDIKNHENWVNYFNDFDDNSTYHNLSLLPLLGSPKDKLNEVFNKNMSFEVLNSLIELLSEQEKNELIILYPILETLLKPYSKEQTYFFELDDGISFTGIDQAGELDAAKWNYMCEILDVVITNLPANFFRDRGIQDSEISNWQLIMAKFIFDNNVTEFDAQYLSNLYEEILSQRESLRDKTLFNGRNCIRLRNPEGYFDGIFEDSIINAEEALSYQSLVLDSEDTERFETQLFAQLRDTPPPLTFMYNGHGLPEGMYYTEGSEEVEKYLSVREFGNVLIERYRLYGEEAVKNDIYIFSACYQENFIMNLTAYLASRNCPPSIFISAAERNLVARDTWGDYIGGFEATTLGMEAIAKNLTNEFITIGTILDNESRQEHSNPTVFIPVDGHRNNLLQISQANPDTEPLNQTSRPA